MVRRLSILCGVALLAVAAWTGTASSKGQAGSLSGRGLDIRVPARLAVVVGLRVRYRREGQLQRRRERRGHPGDHEPPGRLRRKRRADEPRPVLGLQRLRPDSVGPVGDVDPVQRERRSVRPEDHGRPARRHLSRQDQEVERPEDQEAEPRRQPSVHRHHAHLPERFQRNDLQLHGVPLEGQRRLALAGWQGHAGELPDRVSAHAAARALPARCHAPTAGSPTSTSPTR